MNFMVCFPFLISFLLQLKFFHEYIHHQLEWEVYLALFSVACMIYIAGFIVCFAERIVTFDGVRRTIEVGWRRGVVFHRTRFDLDNLNIVSVSRKTRINGSNQWEVYAIRIFLCNGATLEINDDREMERARAHAAEIARLCQIPLEDDSMLPRTYLQVSRNVQMDEFSRPRKVLSQFKRIHLMTAMAMYISAGALVGLLVYAFNHTSMAFPVLLCGSPLILLGIAIYGEAKIEKRSPLNS